MGGVTYWRKFAIFISMPSFHFAFFPGVSTQTAAFAPKDALSNFNFF